MKPETRNEKQKERRRVWLARYLQLLIWIGVILFLGSGHGSMNRTSLIIGPLLHFFFPNASPETLLIYHGYVRKFAHFAEYGVLGLLAARAFFGSSLRSGMAAAASVGLCVAVSMTDEFIQSFNPQRTGSIYDVALDLCGAVLAIFVYTFLHRRQRNITPSR